MYICRGVMRKAKKNIYEIQTIINNKQLINKQLHKTKEAREREISDAVKLEPNDLF